MKQPALFIPHGGGPCFFMDPADPQHPHSDAMWQPMQEYLAGLVADLPERPRAILLVSGHWETPGFTVHDGAHRPCCSTILVFLHTPISCTGTRRARPRSPIALPNCWSRRALRPRAIRTGLGPWRLHPDEGRAARCRHSGSATVIAPGSRSGDHIAAGRALAPLREEGVLIVGSGMSFHNLRVRGAMATAPSLEWDDALRDAVTDPDPVRRAMRVAAWDHLPHARFAHPREEHLLPLMVALGAGGDDAAICAHRSTVLGWTVSGYRFG
ncbi:DODA-type extradiol aromatic ring-opening family dioxygenase [Sphingobium scionense]